MALEPCWLTDRQIEAARVALTRGIKRGGKVWIRVFPDKPVTKKPQETRMGKGKGAPEGWVAVIKPGRILFEMEGVTMEEARAAFRLAAAKLPMKTKFATRFAEARTTYGKIGVKVWLYKGERLTPKTGRDEEYRQPRRAARS